MRKNISTQDLKTHIGEVVDAVRLRGDRYIIERRGKAMAAIVPLTVNENDERSRRRLFDLIDMVHKKNRDVPPEQIDAAINQARTEVRQLKRRQSKRA